MVKENPNLSKTKAILYLCYTKPSNLIKLSQKNHNSWFCYVRSLNNKHAIIFPKY